MFRDFLNLLIDKEALETLLMISLILDQALQLFMTAALMFIGIYVFYYVL